MAKLVAHGAELFRYFSPRSQALIAVMNDGVTLIRRNNEWKVKSRRKPEVPLEVWRANKLEMKAKLPEWTLKVKTVPSISTLQKWLKSGVCKTPDGYTVEPDGESPNGVPSWAILLGYM